MNSKINSVVANTSLYPSFWFVSRLQRSSSMGRNQWQLVAIWEILRFLRSCKNKTEMQIQDGPELYATDILNKLLLTCYL